MAPINAKFVLLSFLCFAVTAKCGIVSWSMFPPSELTEEKLSVQSAPITSCIADQISPQNGLKEHDKVYSLPGQPKGVKFNQYAGYVNVDSKAGRALFYYFVESPKHTAHKPLVLWLNGGPGCSSIDGGAFQELGPFRVNRDGKTLHWNKYAWNKEANIIFLESPAGVGFSYSNTTSDYQTSGDKRTAHDSYIFLINWLERFPEYKGRDFYITGESYGGHYVPQLAKLVLDNNKCDTKTKINLKGIAMGNALIDSETWIKGQVDFYWTHALISDEIYSGLISNCNFSSLNNLSAACQNFANLAQNASGNINPYMIYAPLCKSPSSYVPDGTIDPCTYIYLDSYMNLPEVQAALHANVTKLPYPWRNCSSQINQNWKDRPETVLPLIEELMGSGLPVWLYSGDVDGVVPVTSTRYGVNKMKLPVMTPWYPWYTSGEVGGYAEGYGNLTFVTVRGAGHLVPSYQPARALALFTSFIMHKLPPTN